MRTILVGNGPSIINTPLGYLIDSYDVIVRFNTFYINGFEKYLGLKTHIWAVNFGWVVYPNNCDIKWTPDYSRCKTIIFVPWTLKYYPGYEKVKSMELPINSEMCLESVAKHADEFYTEEKWASTGLMTIMQFAPCSIVGFDCFLGENHHYVKDTAKNRFHDSIREKQFVDKMIKNGLVSYLT